MFGYLSGLVIYSENNGIVGERGLYFTNIDIVTDVAIL